MNYIASTFVLKLALPFLTGLLVSLKTWKTISRYSNSKQESTVFLKSYPSMFGCRPCQKMDTFCHAELCGLKVQRSLLNTLSAAQSSIDICVCLLTVNNILRRILKLSENGVKVRLVIDKGLLSQGAKGGATVRTALDAADISRVEISSGLMHHKFAIVDDAILIDGSMNWTVASTFGNYENVMITTSKEAIDAYKKAFNHMWIWPNS